MSKLFYFKRHEKDPIAEDNQLTKGLNLRKFTGSPMPGEPFVYEKSEKILKESDTGRSKKD